MEMRTLEEIRLDVLEGRTTSVSLTRKALARSSCGNGQGRSVFIKLFHDDAMATAAAVDQLPRSAQALLPLSGIPLSIKDLFDLRGRVTLAGSQARVDAPPARQDALLVRRLRAAGAVITGTTNMSEFAFSGLGLNPHYGTPLNPFERHLERIPGGSSAGAAISVTDGMAAAAIGTDTGGSVRIPAALCGLTGYKPTARRIPLDGVFPLSSSLDSVGPIARCVADCKLLDAVMANRLPAPPAPFVVDLMRLAVPEALVFEDIDATVATSFERTVNHLSALGAKIVRIPLKEIAEVPIINAKGGFAAAEAFAHHRQLIAEKGVLYDPRVLSRILRGADQTVADYIDLSAQRADLIDRVAEVTAPFDAVIMPTVPRVAPRITQLNSDEDYYRMNALLLRNPFVVNFLDRCAVTLPCHVEGEAPVGFTLMGNTMEDERLLDLAAGVESAISILRV